MSILREATCRSLRGNVDRNNNNIEKIAKGIRRSLRGNVDRNPWAMPSLHGATGRSLRGNVDRNMDQRVLLRQIHGRSLRGNVDRNSSDSISLYRGQVVPYVGTWIEIAMLSFWKTARGVVPYVGTWIEIGLKGEQGPQGPGRSLRGNVDRNIVGELNEALGTGRSLRGNVDRNAMLNSSRTARGVVPYVGTWIEICQLRSFSASVICRSLRGNVDRNLERLLSSQRK